MSTHDVVSAGSPVGATSVSAPVSGWAPYRAAAAALAATAVVSLGDPTTHHVPTCPLYFSTGVLCPFCGGLRAVYELTHLNLGAALRDNVIVVLGIPIAVALWVAWAARRGRPGRRWPTWLKVSLFVLLAVFMAARNVPALSLLRPPGA